MRSDVIEMIPQGQFSRILEIGGGEFPTLLTLRDKYNAEIWGVDIHKCDRRDINLIIGSIEDQNIVSKIPHNYFDLVLANDVVEHIADTDLFFSNIREKLNDNGYLVMSVPNIRQIRSAYHIFVNGRFPRHESGLFDRTHLRWFCKKDILELAARHDFNVINVQSVGRFVPAAIRKTAIAEFLALQNLFVFSK